MAARTRLEQLTSASCLTIREVAARLEVSERQVKRWFAGTQTPRAATSRALQEWWGEPVERLLGPPDAAQVYVSSEELIVTAGRESADHAISVSSALDASAIEHVQAQAHSAARRYYVTQPLVLLTELIQLRNVVYAQLDRTAKPRQQAELYLVAGQVCGLLSSVIWDLGHADVAEEQARAAFTYGNVIDHLSLQAWARALQVTVTFWSGRPRRAAAIASAALETAPVGTARARLHAVHARSLALFGDRAETSAELARCSEELDRAGSDPLLDEVGGELGFDRCRRALCAGASFVALGDANRAEAEATAALSFFADVPDSQRWQAGQLSARVDLGSARVLRNDLAGVEQALAPVFGLDPMLRTESLTRRLNALGRVLGHSRFRGAIEARRMGDAIEEFSAGSVRSVAGAAITAGP